MVKDYRQKNRVKSDRLDRIGTDENVKSRNVKHFIKNFFLSDLSNALRNGFHSSSSLASAILNDGIVLPIVGKSPVLLLYRRPNPFDDELSNDGYNKYELAL
jgi:hypothetical protein